MPSIHGIGATGTVLRDEHRRGHQEALDGRADAGGGRALRRRHGGHVPARRRVGRPDVRRAVGRGAAVRRSGSIDLGVGVGDRVCIACNTRVEFTVADLAASSVGRHRRAGVPVELARRVRVGRRRLRRQGHRLRERRPGGQDRPGPRRAARPRARRRSSTARRRAPCRWPRSPPAAPAATSASSTGASALVGPDDACLIIYTSGTTGRPKGVVLTNKGFAAGAPLGDRDGAVRAGRRRLPLPAAGPRVRPAHPGRLHRGRRGHRLLGRRHHGDRRRARRRQADRAAVRAADLREGLRRRHEHGAGRAARRRRRRPSPSG